MFRYLGLRKPGPPAGEGAGFHDPCPGGVTEADTRGLDAMGSALWARSARLSRRTTGHFGTPNTRATVAGRCWATRCRSRLLPM